MNRNVGRVALVAGAAIAALTLVLLRWNTSSDDTAVAPSAAVAPSTYDPPELSDIGRRQAGPTTLDATAPRLPSVDPIDAQVGESESEPDAPNRANIEVFVRGKKGGQGVADVRVVVAFGGQVLRASTSASGWAKFEVPADTHLVCEIFAAHMPPEHRAHAVPPPHPIHPLESGATQQIEFVLDEVRAIGLVVRAVAAESGEPLALAAIDVIGQGTVRDFVPTLHYHVTDAPSCTEEDGLWPVNHSAWSDFAVMVQCPSRSVSFAKPDLAAVASGKMEVRLPLEARLHGTIGSAASGALSVIAECEIGPLIRGPALGGSADFGRLRWTASVDALGNYEIGELPSDAGIEVWIAGGADGDGARQQVRLEPGEVRKLDF